MEYDQGLDPGKIVVIQIFGAKSECYCSSKISCGNSGEGGLLLFLLVQRKQDNLLDYFILMQNIKPQLDITHAEYSTMVRPQVR